MSQLSKFSELIRNATTHERVKILNDIKAAAPSLPLADLQALSAALSEEVRAQQAKDSAKTKRIARMAAAKADPKMAGIIVRATAELKRLDLDIDTDFGDNSVHNLKKLNDAMKAAAWDEKKRLTLKAAAYQLGLID